MQPTIENFENVMLYIVTSKLMPQGFDKTEDGSLCDTFAKVQAHYEKTGKILVWKGASDNTIFSSPQFNHIFRAWHDYHHLKHNLAFDKEGENQVMLEQYKDCLNIGLGAKMENFIFSVLDAEINGQVEYFETMGYFPEDQKAFTLSYIKQAA
jgi:hypothetical protein